MTSQPFPSPTHVETPTPVAQGLLKYNKKVLKSLGIAEVAIGSLSIVLSCIMLGYVHDPANWPYHDWYYNTFNIGEGIWCGIWTLVAGALGIVSGGKRPTLCLINSHMGFSIVGAIFSVVQVSMGIWTIFSTYSPALSIGLEVMIAIGGLANFIMCIVSAVYCCKTISSTGLENGCGTCCSNELVTTIGGRQVVYMTNPQSHQQVQQGVVQTYPTIIPGQQGVYPGNYVTFMQPGVAASQQPVYVAQQSAYVAQQPQASPVGPGEPFSQGLSKEQEAMEPTTSATANVEHGESPPVYS